MCAQCRGQILDRRQWLLGQCAVTMGLVFSPADAFADALIEPQLHVQRGSSDQTCVALTLDACSGHTDFALLEQLVAWHVPATLFVTGQWVAANPAAVAFIKAHEALFTLGNHGGQHRAAIWGRAAPFGVRAVGSVEGLRDEIVAGEQAILNRFGQKPRWFRGATACYIPKAVPLIAAMGYAVAGYSLNADAGASLSAAAVRERVERAAAGDVILAHMNHPERACGRGLIAGLDRLLSRSVRFVTLDGIWQATHTAQHASATP